MGDYTAEEQCNIIAKRISRGDDALLSYPTDIQTYAESNDYHKALTKLIEESERLFRVDVADDEVLGAFNCISLLLCSKIDAATIAEVAIHLADKICQETARAAVRLRILSNLFNNLSADSHTRYELYLIMINYACTTKELALLKPNVEQVDTWLKVWGGGVTVAQARTMYRSISKGLNGAEAQKFIYKFLETYNEDAAAGLEGVKEDAMSSMITAMKDPEVFQLDYLTQLSAIQQLKDTPEFKLFQIIHEGTAKDLRAFTDASPGVLDKIGIDEGELTRKLKLLTLVSLCSGRTEVTYEEIRTVVGVEEDEVELFIIDAIDTKVIEAKMDQMRQVLNVQYVMQRSFKRKDWDTIEDKLTKFRQGLLEVISLRKRKL